MIHVLYTYLCVSRHCRDVEYVRYIPTKMLAESSYTEFVSFSKGDLGVVILDQPLHDRYKSRYNIKRFMKNATFELGCNLTGTY